MTDQFHYTDGQGHRLTLDAVVGAAGTPFVRVTAEDTAIGGSIASVWLKLDQAAALARHLTAYVGCELTDHTSDTLTVTVAEDFTTFTVTRLDDEDDNRASVPVVALTGRLPEIRRALTATVEQAQQRATPSDAELIEHARTVGMVEPEKAPAFLAAFRAHAEEQSASIGTRPVPQPAEERYPTLLGVFCDTCDIEFRGDFIVTDTMTKAERLNVVRAHVRSLGWQCDAAGDFCPECEPSAPTAAQAQQQQQPEAAEEQPTTADVFTEAAVSRSALLAGANAIEALPQDYECDPGRGDAVKVLRRLAHHHTTNEQPAGLTWEARAEHAVRLYATTAIEREDALADAARLRTRVAELEKRDAWLSTLEAAGVDSWSGMEHAISMRNDDQAGR